MSIVVNPELEARLKARASEDGVSLDAFLNRLLSEEESEASRTDVFLSEAAESGEHLELTEAEWDRMEREALG